MSNRASPRTGNQVERRFAFLSQISEGLSYRTDVKIHAGCHTIGKELSKVQERIYAQLFGVRGLVMGQTTPDFLFRWLLIHSGGKKSDFHLTSAHEQWPKIIGQYFKHDGIYMELVCLEKLLLTILRSRKPTPIIDVMRADRLADRFLKTDLIFHLGPKGEFHLGVQFSVNNHFNAKIADILSRPMHDRSVMDQCHDTFVYDLLRHGTGVLSFLGVCHVSDEDRETRKEQLLVGSREYQSRFLKEKDPHFERYGRWVMDIFTALQEGIASGAINYFPRELQDFTYLHNTKSGVIKVSIKTISNKSVVIMEYFLDGVINIKQRPIVFALPLDPETLDVYRKLVLEK